MTELQHKTMQAATTVTDRGEFTAIAAAYTVDRVKDRIIPGAFAKTIKRWQDSGKMIPLHYDHKGDPEFIIGAVDPATMQEVPGKGLQVGGQLDLENSAVARETWRLMKSGVLGMSFGYIAKGKKAPGGIQDLEEIDLFECTITPSPCQFDTQFLSLKGMTEPEPEPEAAPIDIGAEAWRLVLRDELLAFKGKPIIIPDAQTDEPTPEVKIATAAAEPPVEVNIAPEAWKFILRDELERVPKSKPADEPKALARFPDVQTEDDFKALSFHDKLSVYYAGLDDGAMDVEADEQPAKAAWAKAYSIELPDSSFLYCGRFTEKDEKGNMATEDRRFFPVRKPDGTLDVAHLRDALTRISLSSLPQKVKEKLTAETHQALKKISADTTSAVEDGGKGQVPATKSPAPQDPLVREAWELVLPRASRRFPGRQAEPEPEPLDPVQVQREAWELVLKASGA